MENDSEGEWIRLDPKRLLPREGNRGEKFPLPHRPMDVQKFLLPKESKAEYYSLLAELAIDFPPVDFVTSMLVERLGQQIWSLRRHARAEATRYRSSPPGNRPLSSFSVDSLKFLERMEKNTLRMIKELQRLKKERAVRPLSKEAQAKVPAELLLNKHCETIGLDRWWRDPDAFFRYQVWRYVSPDELE